VSAFQCFTYPDRVEILTDGALYDDDGRLTAITRKVWTSVSVPLAITGRGDFYRIKAIADVARMFSECGSFDQTLEQLNGFLAPLGGEDVPYFEVIVAGISETVGPSVYFAAPANVYGLPNFKAWTFERTIGDIGAGPFLTEHELAAVGMSRADLSNGLLEIAVPYFDAMRRKPAKSVSRPDLPEVYGIGGHIDWTVVIPGGTATVRVHRWPDVVGERIEAGAILLAKSKVPNRLREYQAHDV
jgi:hypothetical protein